MAYKKLKYWFDGELAEMLASKIKSIKSEFPGDKFIDAVDKGVRDLELKDRVELMADQLAVCLGEDFNDNIKVLLKTLGPENKEETGMFTNYYWIMPIAKYVEKYGLESFDLSIEAINEITKRNTGEYAIRPFYVKYPKETLTVMQDWSKDSNVHVRRLSSEGLRPRLPWASKIQELIDNPTPLTPILDNLKDDPSKFVQKSVANCLNDILKDNPQTAESIVAKWCVNPTPQRKWIIKHALRNLIKQKDKWAVEIIKKAYTSN